MHTAVLSLRLADAGGEIGAVRDALKQYGLRIDSLEVSRIGPGGVQEMQIRMALPTTCDLTILGPEIAKLEGFVSMRCE
jgi:hypothetical protein